MAKRTQPLGKTAGSRFGVFIFCFVFTSMGLVFLGAFTLWPLWKSLQARSWPAVPCEILTSEVKTERGSKGGRIYRVAITYRYRFDGQRFTGDRYSFSQGSSSGRDRKQDAVNRFPPGSAAECFVNPEEPAEAVLERRPTAAVFWGLIGLPFFLIGVFSIYGLLQEEAPLPQGREAYYVAVGQGESVDLSPTTSPRARLFGIGFIALFWNGITAVFVVDVIDSWWRGHPEKFLTVFMLPFVAIGLYLIWHFLRAVLALGNPRVHLTLGSKSIPLGGEATLQWATERRVERLRTFTLSLEGAETATYRRGKSTTTNRRVFHRTSIFETQDPAEMRTGFARLHVPADTMHSFKTTNNAIAWTLKLRGDIPNFPNLEEEYPIDVRPPAPRQHGR